MCNLQHPFIPLSFQIKYAEGLFFFQSTISIFLKRRFSVWHQFRASFQFPFLGLQQFKATAVEDWTEHIYHLPINLPNKTTHTFTYGKHKNQNPKVKPYEWPFIDLDKKRAAGKTVTTLARISTSLSASHTELIQPSC